MDLRPTHRLCTVTFGAVTCVVVVQPLLSGHFGPSSPAGVTTLVAWPAAVTCAEIMIFNSAFPPDDPPQSCTRVGCLASIGPPAGSSLRHPGSLPSPAHSTAAYRSDGFRPYSGYCRYSWPTLSLSAVFVTSICAANFGIVFVNVQKISPNLVGSKRSVADVTGAFVGSPVWMG